MDNFLNLPNRRGAITQVSRAVLRNRFETSWPLLALFLATEIEIPCLWLECNWVVHSVCVFQRISRVSLKPHMGEIIDKAFEFAGTKPDAAEGIFEHFFDSIGLMGPSEFAPYYRFLFGWGAVSTLLWAVRPGQFFNAKGGALPWSVVSQDKDAVSIPWWSLGLVAGIFCSVFI